MQTSEPRFELMLIDCSTRVAPYIADKLLSSVNLAIRLFLGPKYQKSNFHKKITGS
jgi:hypothetical protein